MRIARRCLPVILTGLLAACGAKGPLYLPAPATPTTAQGDLTPNAAIPTTTGPASPVDTN